MIQFENALKNRRCYRRVKKLYTEAFPANERPPLLLLALKARKGAGEILGVYDDETFVGLTILVHHADMVYVFFLAVEAAQRGAGRGASILAELAQRHTGKRLMLAIEDPDAPCDNLPLRLRRRSFYLRNGYQPTGFKLCESGVVYEMLATAPVTYGDYQQLMTAFLGDKLFAAMHKPVA